MQNKFNKIVSKKDLKYFIESDRLARGMSGRKRNRFDDIGDFLIALRYYEFAVNVKKPLSNLFRYFHKYRYVNLSRINGFTIPPNVCGPGLSLAHRGTIVINPYAKIGNNCQINVCVNIGARNGSDTVAPKIGNNVYIGPGAKIFGDIEIADGIAIGANAVVNKSFLEKDITIAGVPAKKIKDIGSAGLIIRATEIIASNGQNDF